MENDWEFGDINLYTLNFIMLIHVAADERRFTLLNQLDFSFIKYFDFLFETFL